MPIILEGGSFYFNTQIYDDLNLLETAFPTLEWEGAESLKEMEDLFSHIYNKDHIQLISRNIGKNLHYWRVFTDNLIHIQDKNPDFYKLLDCNGPEWDKEYQKFCYKINSMYDRPEVEYLLNNGTLNFAILDVLSNFFKSPVIMVMGPIGEEIKQKSIIRVFIELGLLYPQKHNSYLYCLKIHSKFFEKYYKQAIKKMTLSEKIAFRVWTLTKGIHTKGMDENLDRNIYSSYYDAKNMADWDADIYDPLAGKRSDPGIFYPEFIDPHSGKIIFESYGKGTDIGFIRYQLTPINAFLDKFLNYPNAFMNLQRKNKLEGNPEPVITQPVHKWIDRRATVSSELPQTDSEVRVWLSPEEKERAILKAAYIYDNPEKYRNLIKWRHVRRYARNVYLGKGKTE
jgi:hypothetical protein